LTSFFLSFQSSQLLSFLHAHNLNFKEKPCKRRDETLKVGCVQGMRCTKEMYRFGYGIRQCTGLRMWKPRCRMHDEASNKKISTRTWSLLEIKTPKREGS
jgi:hypothetical protein